MFGTAGIHIQSKLLRLIDHSFMRGQLVITCLSVTLLSACSYNAGPDYQRPELPKKDQWSQLSGRELSTSEVIQPNWWRGFGDATLNELIQKALDDGLDLKIAAARLDQAGIQLLKDRFPLTPDITAAPTGSITRARSDDGVTDTNRESELVGASLNWEIDIWGKIRKGVKAAEAGYKGAEMDWRGAYLTLISDVAQRYFQIRLFDEQIDQQVTTMQQNLEFLKIYEAQYREGLIPETKILNQKSEINSLTNQLLDLKRSRTESELRLATLLGIPAGNFSVPVAPLRESVRLIGVPRFLPADLLSRRPDVLRAEFALLRSHHLVGKARLARLPTFSLSATANTGSSLVTRLVDSWSFGLASSLAPMFDRNLKIDVKINQADVRVQIHQYRKAVLKAFEEVEIVLLNLDSRQRQMRELEEQINRLRIVRGVQQARLQEGLVSQLEVFETERTLLSAQKGILSAYQQLLTDTLTLYKALGGGWPVETVTEESTVAGILQPIE